MWSRLLIFPEVDVADVGRELPGNFSEGGMIFSLKLKLLNFSDDEVSIRFKLNFNIIAQVGDRWFLGGDGGAEGERKEQGQQPEQEEDF